MEECLRGGDDRVVAGDVRRCRRVANNEARLLDLVCANEEDADPMTRRQDQELVTVRELLDRYRLLGFEPHVPPLNAAHVPEPLRHLIPYAQIWGVADDTLRLLMLRRASEEALSDLKHVVAAADDLLDEWLAGPEAYDPDPSDEYVAFSAMRMVADTGDA